MTDKKEDVVKCTPLPIDGSILNELVHTTMPFGRYQGRRLVDLPEPYLVWFSRQGFPQGRLGAMMATVLEIKVNGLEYLLRPLGL